MNIEEMTVSQSLFWQHAKRKAKEYNEELTANHRYFLWGQLITLEICAMNAGIDIGIHMKGNIVNLSYEDTLYTYNTRTGEFENETD